MRLSLSQRHFTQVRIIVLVALFVALSFPAFGDSVPLPDPNIMVGATLGACPASCSFDPNTLNATGFDLFSNGSPTADIPWYILLAIPGQGSTIPTAPTIAGTGFTISLPANEGQFKSTTSGDIYSFVSGATGGLNGDNSMNSSNLFGASELAAFGGTPDFFQIYLYTVSAGALTGGTNFFFDTSPDMIAGTFVAGLGVGANGNQPFSTPFTTAGLVTNIPEENLPRVPEPTSLTLLGAGLLAIASAGRRKLQR